MKFPFPDEIKFEIKTKNKLLKKYKSKKRQVEDYNTELDNFRASIKSLKSKISVFNNKLWTDFTNKVGPSPISSRLWLNKIKKNLG